MTTTATTKPCRKCGGSGYLPHLTRVDAGRCWACLPAAPTPTAEQVADDEAYRADTGLGLTLAEQAAARRARRAANRAAEMFPEHRESIDAIVAEFGADPIEVEQQIAMLLTGDTYTERDAL